MIDTSLLIRREEILNKAPEEGDFVMYTIWNARTHTNQTAVGVIAEEVCDVEWLINGSPRYKEQVLFALDREGYFRQLRCSNPYAY